jgi:hypothetical protein
MSLTTKVTAFDAPQNNKTGLCDPPNAKRLAGYTEGSKLTACRPAESMNSNQIVAAANVIRGRRPS